MSDFEKWFIDQDFYTNMRFVHGDALFIKDGDVYRVLSVQMVYQGWSTQRQRSKDEFIALTQEWHTKGWDARQDEIDHLSIMNQRYTGKMQEQQDQIAELKTVLKQLSVMNHKSISYEHDLFDKGWNQCAKQTIENIYRLTAIDEKETIRGDDDINLSS